MPPYSLIKFPSVMSTLSAIIKPMLDIAFCLRRNSVTASAPSTSHKYHSTHTTTNRHKTHIKYSDPKWLYTLNPLTSLIYVYIVNLQVDPRLPISITLKRETIRRYCKHCYTFGYRIRKTGHGFFLCEWYNSSYLLLCIMFAGIL